jgi:hypothetical protein
MVYTMKATGKEELANALEQPVPWINELSLSPIG